MLGAPTNDGAITIRLNAAPPRMAREPLDRRAALRFRCARRKRGRMKGLPHVSLLVCIASFSLAACDESKLQPQKPVDSAKPTAASASAAAPAAKPLPPMPKAPPLPATPQPLPELKTPADNPLTPEKVDLGKQLFFDKRLSKDGTMACESCHLPDKGWTDGKALSTKVGGGV